jgi:hypothetical protein
MEDILKIHEGPSVSRQTLYSVHVSDKLGPDAALILYDVLRMVCIQASIQGMLTLSSPNHPFLTVDFFVVLLYIILGVVAYWLIVRRAVSFT